MALTKRTSSAASSSSKRQTDITKTFKQARPKTAATTSGKRQSKVSKVIESAKTETLKKKASPKTGTQKKKADEEEEESDEEVEEILTDVDEDIEEIAAEDVQIHESEPLTSGLPLEKFRSSGRYGQLYRQAKSKRGADTLVHEARATQQKEDPYLSILSVFDNSYEYGPSIGVTRLERWERAYNMGLNPPAKIREILLTQEGVKDSLYRENVFYDQV